MHDLRRFLRISCIAASHGQKDDFCYLVWLVGSYIFHQIGWLFVSHVFALLPNDHMHVAEILRYWFFVSALDRLLMLLPSRCQKINHLVPQTPGRPLSMSIPDEGCVEEWAMGFLTHWSLWGQYLPSPCMLIFTGDSLLRCDIFFNTLPPTSPKRYSLD